MQVAVRLGNRSQLIIPKRIRDKLGIGPGKEVILQLVHNTIVLRVKPENYTQHMCGLGKDIWKGADPAEYVKKERAAWEETE